MFQNWQFIQKYNSKSKRSVNSSPSCFSTKILFPAISKKIQAVNCTAVSVTQSLRVHTFCVEWLRASLAFPGNVAQAVPCCYFALRWRDWGGRINAKQNNLNFNVWRKRGCCFGWWVAVDECFCMWLGTPTRPRPVWWRTVRERKRRDARAAQLLLYIQTCLRDKWRSTHLGSDPDPRWVLSCLSLLWDQTFWNSFSTSYHNKYRSTDLWVSQPKRQCPLGCLRILKKI